MMLFGMVARFDRQLIHNFIRNTNLSDDLHTVVTVDVLTTVGDVVNPVLTTINSQLHTHAPSKLFLQDTELLK